MALFTSIWDAKKAIDITLKKPTAITPVKNKFFGGQGIVVDSFTLPQRYITQSLKHMPMVWNSNNPEPMGKKIITANVSDIGSMFAVDHYTAQEQARLMQLTGKSFASEMSLMAEDGMVHKDTYVEDMLASCLTGTMTKKYRENDGSWASFTLDFGTVSSTTVTAGWDSATLGGVFNDLTAMKEEIEGQLGYKISKRDVGVLAGGTVFARLVTLVETKDNINTLGSKLVTTEEFDYVEIGGFRVWDIDGTYTDAETGTATQAVGAKYVQMVVTGRRSGNAFYYLKLENNKANHRPLPLFMYPYDLPNGKGFDMYYESKPVPVFNINSTTKAQVIA